MPSGGSWNPWFRRSSRAVAQPSIPAGRWWMPSGTCCAPAVPGGCCPTNWSTTFLGLAAGWHLAGGPRRPAFQGSQVWASQTQSLLSLPKSHRQPERSRVRRGQKGEGPQTAYRGGYPGPAAGGGGAPGRRARPGRSQAGVEPVGGPVSPAGADLG